MSQWLAALHSRAVICSRLFDELFRVAEGSPLDGFAGGLGEHSEPMCVKIRFIAEQISVADGVEKSPHRLAGRHTVSVEHVSRDPGQTLARGAPCIPIHRPFCRRFDQTTTRFHRAVVADDRPADFSREAGTAEPRGFEIDEGDLPRLDGVIRARHCERQLGRMTSPYSQETLNLLSTTASFLSRVKARSALVLAISISCARSTSPEISSSRLPRHPTQP